MKTFLFLAVIITTTVVLRGILPADVVVVGQQRCVQPMQLMLHSAYGPERMAQLAELILEKNIRTMTYRQVYSLLGSGQCPPPNTVLVSLDDLSGVWLRPTFREMIYEFTSRGLVLTVGVVTGDPNSQNPEIWEYFRMISRKGVEIASHTRHHSVLSSGTESWIREELGGSHDTICVNLGECPETLILPYGDGHKSKLLLEISLGLYQGIVSILGPSEIAGEPPFVFRRVLPNNDNQEITLISLERSFPQEKIGEVILPGGNIR